MLSAFIPFISLAIRIFTADLNQNINRNRKMKKTILSLLFACAVLTVRAQEGVETGTISTRGTTFVANYVNRTSGALTFDCGVGILTAEGYVVPLTFLTANDLAAGGSTGGVFLDVQPSLKGRNGVHRLVPIARLSETAPWFITLAPRESYVEAKVENGTVSLSNKRNEAVTYSLLVPTMTFAPVPTADQPTTIAVKVRNQGNLPFAGSLYLSATYTGQLRQEPLSLAPAASHDFSVAYTPATGGKITFTLSLDDKGEKVVYAQTVEVAGENRQVAAKYWTADAKQPKTVEGIGTLNIPAGAIAVYTEMPDAITPDATQPNRLYFFPQDALVSTDFDNYNTVIGNRAERIVLEDGHPFSTPKSFTATSIVYRRTVGLTSDGKTGGWETIVLPFDAAEVHDHTAGGTLLWHKTADDNGKFWLRQLDKVENDACQFSPVTGEMESYTPYLVGFPGASFGTGSLAGHVLEWRASEAEIYPDMTLTAQADGYELTGAFTNDPLPSSVYVLNASGTAFERTAGAVASPFRAVLTPLTASSATRLPIVNPDLATGIGSVTSERNPLSAPRYGLDGRRVRTTAKGIVIVQGKKIFSGQR